MFVTVYDPDIVTDANIGRQLFGPSDLGLNKSCLLYTSPEMVMSYYSNFYPELTTATVHGPVSKNDKAVYEFKTTIGTKG